MSYSVHRFTMVRFTSHSTFRAIPLSHFFGQATGKENVGMNLDFKLGAAATFGAAGVVETEPQRLIVVTQNHPFGWLRVYAQSMCSSTEEHQNQCH